ncbi:ABC transporter, ATP-binding protein (cluster 5, nickel/peptides/opines) / ABC transporter, ATP-binding protein (cluster 5, nickel/peptides/opines) [hydrothermal vent metagenome]|uniref:ABC transporter, ATP-binding protein (Cluster 5, nickel/peptides/opines) / ABC transporter, ATP-binding protein (Cluster 5, nickel/peptides/opines) n=1 Tax=hydrothermal vent metagenome TaxID=652676 RepID=A0A3B0ZKJ2_9ZZZZ
MLLQVDNLKTYLRAGKNIVKAVDGVSFSIDKGEIFCLVGESGSGKSITALSVIQLIPNDICSHPDGRIAFRCGDLDGNGERATLDMLTISEETKRKVYGARIAMIFQEPMTSLNPVITIGEQIIEVLQIHWPEMDDAEAHRRAIAALAQVQIPEPEMRIDEYPHRLSGGQRQRVMIAMAMACEPDLLIADEPTTALDVTVQAEILRLMKELQERKGMSILFITHDFGVVAKMADRVAVMRKGKIVEEGTLQQVLHQPKHDYTKQLLAALPENLKRQRDLQLVEHPSPVISTEKERAQPPLIDVQQLEVYFPIKKGLFHRTVDHVKAVDGVDLQIPKGQLLALVGESGCGKTTLGRAILRLVDSTAGTIAFKQQEITHLQRKAMIPFRREMQIIFQDPMSSLNPRMTIVGTLIEPMAVHGIGESKDERIEIARKMLERVQLDADHLWRYPHEFSGGQRQRIGLARALVLNPEFIVCDEVTSALDVSVQAEVLQLLMELRAEKDLTLLFITHDISVVEYVSDEMAVMHNGKIVERGPTADICRNPQQEYTQNLLAAVPRLVL